MGLANITSSRANAIYLLWSCYDINISNTREFSFPAKIQCECLMLKDFDWIDFKNLNPKTARKWLKLAQKGEKNAFAELKLKLSQK